MTAPAIELTPDQAAAARRIDALDLEPITYKLMHPEPGEQAMTLAAADQLVTAYRQFLKLCAWYPQEAIVPSTPVDEVWHTHILDTAKYAADSQAVFGFFAHHFPYLGLRGPADEVAWHAAYARTRALSGRHFGTELPAGRAGRACLHNGQSCYVDGSLCVAGPCDKSDGGILSQARPRPVRPAANQAPAAWEHTAWAPRDCRRTVPVPARARTPGIPFNPPDPARPWPPARAPHPSP